MHLWTQRKLNKHCTNDNCLFPTNFFSHGRGVSKTCFGGGHKFTIISQKDHTMSVPFCLRFLSDGHPAQALGCSGCSWLLLAAPGYSWLLLAAPGLLLGCSWLLLAAPAAALGLTESEHVDFHWKNEAFAAQDAKSIEIPMELLIIVQFDWFEALVGIMPET